MALRFKGKRNKKIWRAILYFQQKRRKARAEILASGVSFGSSVVSFGSEKVTFK